MHIRDGIPSSRSILKRLAPELRDSPLSSTLTLIDKTFNQLGLFGQTWQFGLHAYNGKYRYCLLPTDSSSGALTIHPRASRRRIALPCLALHPANLSGSFFLPCFLSSNGVAKKAILPPSGRIYCTVLSSSVTYHLICHSLALTT